MNFKIELPESDIKCWKDHLNMLGSKLPTFKDLAIKQKWDSIYYRYESARMFLMLAKEPNDNLIEINGCSENSKKLFELRQQINFYESALINYNILIDYSWQLVYFCFEYVYYKKEKNVDIDDMIEINEAREILNKLEKDVKCPLNEESALHYFEKFNAVREYKEVFDLINNFWTWFKDTELRKNYNKLKHCGNLLYEEELRFS